ARPRGLRSSRVPAAGGACGRAGGRAARPPSRRPGRSRPRREAGGEARSAGRLLRGHRRARTLMPRAYVGLGSNMGDRERMLWSALHMLVFNPEVEVVAVSSFRETDPVGLDEQPRFLNAAAAIETDLEPRALLDLLLSIELELGRARDGPRFG